MQTVATSLKVPTEIRQGVIERANAQGVTAHSYMLRAIEATLEVDRQRAAFDAAAMKSLAQAQRTGKTYDFEELATYLEGRARGEKLPKPKLRATPGLARA